LLEQIFNLFDFGNMRSENVDRQKSKQVIKLNETFFSQFKRQFVNFFLIIGEIVALEGMGLF
jgi:hypothetical protein